MDKSIDYLPAVGDRVVTGLGRIGTVVDTYELHGRPCAHVQTGDDVTGWYAWSLRKLDFKVGDHVIAGAGMRAELRSTMADDSNTATVRWLNRSADGRWWGYDHSRVPWSTVHPIPEDGAR